MPRCVGIRGGKKGAMHSVNTADPRRAFSSPLGRRRRRAHTARKKEGKEKIYGALLVPLLRGERALERCIYHLEIRIGKGEGESTLLLLLLSCSARYAFHLASLSPPPPLLLFSRPLLQPPSRLTFAPFPHPFLAVQINGRSLTDASPPRGHLSFAGGIADGTIEDAKNWKGEGRLAVFGVTNKLPQTLPLSSNSQMQQRMGKRQYLFRCL